MTTVSSLPCRNRDGRRLVDVAEGRDAFGERFVEVHRGVPLVRPDERNEVDRGNGATAAAIGAALRGRSEPLHPLPLEVPGRLPAPEGGQMESEVTSGAEPERTDALGIEISFRGRGADVPDRLLDVIDGVGHLVARRTAVPQQHHVVAVDQQVVDQGDPADLRSQGHPGIEPPGDPPPAHHEDDRGPVRLRGRLQQVVGHGERIDPSVDHVGFDGGDRGGRGRRLESIAAPTSTIPHRFIMERIRRLLLLSQVRRLVVDPAVREDHQGHIIVGSPAAVHAVAANGRDDVSALRVEIGDSGQLDRERPTPRIDQEPRSTASMSRPERESGNRRPPRSPPRSR